MDAGVQAGLLKAAASLGISHKAMASGGGHDAAAFAQAGVPAGMVPFSGTRTAATTPEAMRIEDFAAATAVVVSRFVQDISQ